MTQPGRFIAGVRSLAQALGRGAQALGLPPFGAPVLARASISHTVIRACRRCRAPGLFKSEARIRDGWSGCYVPPGDPREDQPVGDFCPHCGAPRGAELIEDRGVVWRGTI